MKKNVKNHQTIVFGGKKDVYGGNRMMDLFFPGKFQPPHIGHVITISKLKNIGNVIIGISEDSPQIIPIQKVLDIFKTIFNGSVDYFLIKGRLIDYKNIEGFPNFDVLVSGNDKVIEWGLKIGLAVKRFPRSEGIGCSGEELRRMVKK